MADSLGQWGRPIATFEHCRHVVANFTTNELRALASEGGCTDPVVPVGPGAAPHGGGHHGGHYGGYGAGYGYHAAAPAGHGWGGMGFPFAGFPSLGGMAGVGGEKGGKGEYKEVQIHGPVRLGQDVDALVLHERHKSDPVIRALAEEFGKKHQVTVIYQDDIARWG